MSAMAPVQTGLVPKSGNEVGYHQRSSSPLITKIIKIVLIALLIEAVSNVPAAEGGIVSGLVVLTTCVGAGMLFPTNLWFVAAPCYEFTMIAMANLAIP